MTYNIVDDALRNTGALPTDNMSDVDGPLSLYDEILAYESGELDDDGFLQLFSKLVSTGLAWVLQGSYGRTAMDLIQGGYISTSGKLLTD